MILQMREWDGSHWSKWQTIDTAKTELLDQYAMERLFDTMGVREVVVHFENTTQEWRKPPMKRFYRVSKIVAPNAVPEEVGRLPFNGTSHPIVLTSGSPAYNLMVDSGSYVIQLVEEPDV